MPLQDIINILNVPYNVIMGRSDKLLKIYFGKRLKQIRKSKKLTQEHLSEKIGVNTRQLARIEAGESFVTAETLQNICAALELTPDALFRFATIEDSKNSIYKELVYGLESISADENKIDFMYLAFKALDNKDAIEKLKFLIKGLELNM